MVLQIFLLIPFLTTITSTQLECKPYFSDDNPEPYDNDNTTVLQVVLLLPFNTTYLASCPKVAPAIKATLNKIYRLGLLPTTLRINVTPVDTDCDATTGTWVALRESPQPTHLFLGPHCDYVAASVARSLGRLEAPAVTSGALAYDFGKWNRTEPDSEYYFLVRTGWTFAGAALAVEAVFREFGWKKYVAMFEEHGRRNVTKEHYCYLAMQAMYEVLVLQGEGLMCEMEQHRIPEGKLKEAEQMEDFLKSKFGDDQKKRRRHHPHLVGDSEEISRPVYQCTYCPYTSWYNSHLAQHVRKHTGERPFLCQLCGKGFTQKTNLARHQICHQYQDSKSQ